MHQQATLFTHGSKVIHHVSLKSLFLILLLYSSNGVGTAKAIQRPAGQVRAHASHFRTLVYREISIPDITSGPYHLTVGKDGTLWFTVLDGDELGHIERDGKISVIPLSGARFNNITLGPDGNFWFEDLDTGAFGRVTLKGKITLFPSKSSSPINASITLGPDGNLWFAAGVIGRITPQGSITTYQIDTNDATTIITGPDKNLWFVGSTVIGSITTQGHVTILSNYTDTTNGNGGYIAPRGITVGPDGNLWVNMERASHMQPPYIYFERITPPGTSTSIASPSTLGYQDFGTPAFPGPDGNPWFTCFNGEQVIGAATPQGFYGSFKGPEGINHLISFDMGF